MLTFFHAWFFLQRRCFSFSSSPPGVGGDHGVLGCCMNKECYKSRRNWCWRCGNHRPKRDGLGVVRSRRFGTSVVGNPLDAKGIEEKHEKTPWFEGLFLFLEDDAHWFSNNEDVERRQSFLGGEKMIMIHWYIYIIYNILIFIDRQIIFLGHSGLTSKLEGSKPEYWSKQIIYI